MNSSLDEVIGRTILPPAVIADEPWAARAERPAPRGDLLLARGGVVAMLDATLATCGLALGYLARYTLHLGHLHGVIAPVSPVTFALLGAVAVALTLLELGRNGVYRRPFGRNGLDGCLAVVRAATVAMAAVIVTSTALREQSVARLAYI
jgi:hypothetical protein